MVVGMWLMVVTVAEATSEEALKIIIEISSWSSRVLLLLLAVLLLRTLAIEEERVFSRFRKNNSPFLFPISLSHTVFIA